ncbi:MAG: hypothetical protein Q7T78_09295 [Rhodoferax sp.]|nr:hypothetical protein [Rhodoferax sp.]
MVITPHLKQAVENATEVLMRDIKGVKAVLVSTEDGFEVAARVENTAQIARLSAMASSLAALGAMAGDESRLGNCNSLIVEASEGFISIVQIRRDDVSFILSVIAGRDAVVGQALYFSKQAARLLEKA